MIGRVVLRERPRDAVEESGVASLRAHEGLDLVSESAGGTLANAHALVSRRRVNFLGSHCLSRTGEIHARGGAECRRLSEHDLGATLRLLLAPLELALPLE
jgi:hypothetical protein